MYPLLSASTYSVPILFSKITCHMAIKRRIHYCRNYKQPQEETRKHAKYRGLFLKFNKNNTYNFKNTFTVKSNSYSVLKPFFQVSVIYSQSPSRVLTLSSNICVKSRGTTPWGHPQIIYTFVQTPLSPTSVLILWMPF